MSKKVISTAALLGMIAIILGAFGAHALKKYFQQNNLLPSKRVFAIKCTMLYSYYSLVWILLYLKNLKNHLLFYRNWSSFILRLHLFLATNNLTSFDFTTIGFITPIGGVFLILAWTVLLFDFLKTIKENIKQKGYLKINLYFYSETNKNQLQFYGH